MHSFDRLFKQIAFAACVVGALIAAVACAPTGGGQISPPASVSANDTSVATQAPAPAVSSDGQTTSEATPAVSDRAAASEGTSFAETTSSQTDSAPSSDAADTSPASSQGAEQSEDPALDIRSLAAGTVVTRDQVERFGEDACFTVEQIDDALFSRMWGLSYKEYCDVPREDLRYIRVLHTDANGTIHVGEVVMNVAVADDVCRIFHELYRASYPIEKMHLVDDYGASDDASMEDDNTSAFNYRLIEGTDRISNHSDGLAIDSNPYYNPYCIPSQDYVSPASAYAYGNRDWSFPYKIEEGDLCYRLFLEAGFSWGGYWNEPKDYQHFEKAATSSY
ncbi:MAG: M15 family metallopeptidase [Eggerthellaceae bacterium]|nr:M15 family metallopeptidase [Eggerthellaceae bacterium]